MKINNLEELKEILENTRINKEEFSINSVEFPNESYTIHWNKKE